MNADEVRKAVEQVTGRSDLDTEGKQVQALIDTTPMGPAEARDELRIMRGEFPEDGDEMA